jgi:hypothetical protein
VNHVENVTYGVAFGFYGHSREQEGVAARQISEEGHLLNDEPLARRHLVHRHDRNGTEPSREAFDTDGSKGRVDRGGRLDARVGGELNRAAHGQRRVVDDHVIRRGDGPLRLALPRCSSDLIEHRRS